MPTAFRTLRSTAYGLAASFLMVPAALAQISGPDDKIGTPKGDFRTAVVNIINYVLTFVGLIAVAMLIYGGFLYLTAAGSEENTKKAKHIILYAIIGIIVISLSWVIVSTLIDAGDTVIDQRSNNE